MCISIKIVVTINIYIYKGSSVIRIIIKNPL